MSTKNLTGEAVQQMEADLHVAELELQSLRRQNALLDLDASHLRSQVLTLQSERDDAMIKCAEMRMIMESVSSGLVAGLGRMKFTARQRQERTLNVNDQQDRTPFTKTTVERAVVHRETTEQSDWKGAPIDLDEAATAIAPPREPKPIPEQDPAAPNFLVRHRPAVVRTDIVDDRLPPLDFPNHTQRVRRQP